MLASELIAIVRSDIGEPVEGLRTDAEFLTWINRAESDFVGKTRVLQGRANLTLSAGRGNYQLPASVLGVKSAFYVDGADGTSGKPLTPTTMERLLRLIPNPLAETGNPTHFWVWDNEFWLYPTPDDATKTVLVFYEAAPSTLSAVTDSLNVDDSLVDPIISYVKARAWGKEQNANAEQLCMEQYAQGVAEGLRWKSRRASGLVRTFMNPSRRSLR